MVDAPDKDPGLERVIAALIEAAVQNGKAVVEQKAHAASATADVVRDAHRDLASAGRVGVLLPRLLSHPEPAVRLWVASLSLEAHPDLALTALRAIEGPLEKQAADAIRQWESGFEPRVEPIYTCPVCGWPDLHDDPDGQSYEICPSCGIQFGYTDAASTPGGQLERREAWRKQWIQEGMRFSSSSGQPDSWDAAEQLRAAGLDG